MSISQIGTVPLIAGAIVIAALLGLVGLNFTFSGHVA